MLEGKDSKGEEMAGNYLWDGSGEPDSEVQRLEKMLESFRYSSKTPALAIPAIEKPESIFARLMNRSWLPCFAAATTVTLILTGSVIIRRGLSHSDGDVPGWNVA